MADTLSEIAKKVDARLRELEPLVEEYRRLQEVAESLSSTRGGRPAEDTVPSATAPTRAGRSGGARARTSRSRAAGLGERDAGARRRAPRGQNRERILALIAERPGISNREIADATGIGRRVVATAISKYKRDGLLTADGAGVRLTEASPA